MRATYLSCFVFIIVLWTGCVSPEKKVMETQTGQHPQTFEKTITKTVSCQYWLFLPEGYGERQQQWPMILYLHGAGGRGDDLEKAKGWGPPKLVEKKKDFPFIVVSPQCPEGDWWNHHVDTLINLLDDVVSRYDVDTERIYLTGLSMGGYGTWDLSCKYPDRFAAIAPFCGGGSSDVACSLKNVPVWAFHGAEDEVVPLRESKEMVEAVKACGGDARFTVYPYAGHECWMGAYNGKELYDWFLEHRRKR